MEMPKGMGFLGRLFFGITAPRKQVLGTELSGVVSAVGKGVTRFQTGDHVIAFPGADFGAHAEYLRIPEDGKVVAKPAEVSFHDAAAIAFGFTTAYDFLIQKGALQKEERVLINGATGATGSACVQVAKAQGAHVTAVCSAKNADLARDLGADEVIDYTTQNFADGKASYDVIVDTNGKAPWKRSKRALAPKGRMIMISGSFSDMVFGSLKAKLAGKGFIAGVASEDPELLKRLVDLVADGTLRPLVGATFSFSEIVKAHRLVDTGHKRGSVVVIIDENTAIL
jgi:NADPH:quinone reductase-like Zn-dependent oxidoreductase